MSFERMLSVDFDSTQNFFAKKCVKYLEYMKRDEKVIAEFTYPGTKMGHCLGHTGLNLYVLLIQLTEKRQTPLKPRDDWNELKRSFTRIANWNEELNTLKGRQKSRRKLRRAFERYISLVRYIQGELKLDDTRQIEIHHRLQNTRNILFHREYSLAGIVRAVDLAKLIEIKIDGQAKKTTLIDQVIFEDRIVFFTSNTHIVGVIRHHNYFFFYSCDSKSNSNSDFELKAGFTMIDAKDKMLLADHIFLGLQFLYNSFSPLGITVICKSDLQPKKYPSVAVLLDAVCSVSHYQANNSGKTTCLYVAIDIRCYASLWYYLSYPSQYLKKFIDQPHAYDKSPDVPPLLQAAYYGKSAKFITALIQAGANLNYKSSNGETALFIAVKFRDLEAAGELLKHGANPDELCKHNRVVLFKAIERDDDNMIQLLVSYKANLNQVTVNANTLLHHAAIFNSSKAVKILLKYKVNVNVVNGEGLTPLTMALMHHHMDIVECLLKAPFLYMSKKEYDALNLLAQKYPEDEAIATCLMGSHAVYFLGLIKNQLHKIERSQPSFFKKAMQQWVLVSENTRREMIHPRHKIAYIFTQLYPILITATLPKNQLQMWQRPSLTTDVESFAQKFGISKVGFIPPEIKALRYTR